MATKKENGNSLYNIFPNYEQTETTPLTAEQIEFKVQAEPHNTAKRGTAVFVAYIRREACIDLLEAAFGGLWSKTIETPYQLHTEKKEYNKATKQREVVQVLHAGYRCIINLHDPKDPSKIIISRDGHSDPADHEVIKGGDTNAFKRAAALWLKNIRDLRYTPKFAVQCSFNRDGELKAPAQWRVEKAIDAGYRLFAEGKIDLNKGTVYITTTNDPEAGLDKDAAAAAYYVFQNGVVLWESNPARDAETVLKPLLDKCETQAQVNDFWATLSERERQIMHNMVANKGGEIAEKEAQAEAAKAIKRVDACKTSEELAALWKSFTKQQQNYTLARVTELGKKLKEKEEANK